MNRTTLLAGVFVAICLGHAAEAQDPGVTRTSSICGRVATRPVQLEFQETLLETEASEMKPLFAVEPGDAPASVLVVWAGNPGRVRLGRVTGATVSFSNAPQWPKDALEPLGSGDLDGDGFPELIGYAASVGWFALSLRSPSAAVQPLELDPPAHAPQLVAVADDDCDGQPELIFRSPGADVDTYRGTGPMRFKKALGYADVGAVLTGFTHAAQCRKAVYQALESRSRFFSVPSPQDIWAHFLVSDPGARAWMGDFNGDQLADILYNAPNAITPWWLGASNGRTALESAQLRTGLGSGQGIDFVSGDFNGDGITDLIAFQEHGAALILFTSRPGAAVAGAVITIDGNEAAVSDVAGAYTIPSVASAAHTIGVRMNGREFVLPERHVVLRRTVEVINFLATDPEVDRPRPGQIERFGAKPAGPHLCFGYLTGGQDTKWGRSDLCPPGAAVFGTTDFRHRAFSAAQVEPEISCCELPAVDILTDSEEWTSDECPPDSVATGSNKWKKLAHKTPDVPGMIRCTKINTVRYQLGRAERGRYWGLGQSAGFFESEQSAVDLSSLIAPGLSRFDALTFEEDGCVGTQSGAALVGKRSSGCGGLQFRVLQFRGLPGDPPAGTAVPLVPACSAIENVFDPMTGCRAGPYAPAAASGSWKENSVPTPGSLSSMQTEP